MKLNRVERFFNNVRKGVRRRNIPDRVVLMQVFGLLSVDFLICLIWSSVATAAPRQLWVNVAYGNVQVRHPLCSILRIISLDTLLYSHSNTLFHHPLACL